MSSVQKKKKTEGKRKREVNLFTTRVDDGVLLGGDSVKEILWCHHSNEMFSAGLKMEFRFQMRVIKPKNCWPGLSGLWDGYAPAE